MNVHKRGAIFFKFLSLPIRTVKPPKSILNQSGQGVVEAVLLFAGLFFVAVFVSTQFRQAEVVSNVVKAPWRALSGMITNGVWAPANQSTHPSNGARISTMMEDGP